MNPSRTVGVIGASARAAAMSLARAGYSAWAVDLFADRDLKRIASAVRCPLPQFPDGLPTLSIPFAGPFLYTGGMENHPGVVQEIARTRALLGNGPETLRRIRDPLQLAAVLPDVPEILPAQARVPSTGRWLEKSLRSSGGLGVRWAIPGEIAEPGMYLQQLIEGQPQSAVFRGTTLLGITEQLVGTEWLHARQFLYAGTIAPSPVDPEIEDRIAAIGNQLVKEFGLVGLFGIDFIVKEGRPWILEVNPRYPASVEVLEHALGFAALGSQGTGPGAKRVVGKAIYFAPGELRFPPDGPWDADLAGPFDPWRLPGYADIPDPGEPIEAGSPVLTVFASGATAEECRDSLREKIADCEALLASSPAC